MRTYTEKEREGLLLWCIAMLIDDMFSVTKTFANHKPLEMLTKEEFVIENADMALGIVCGQLEEMGIDVDKLRLESKPNHIHHEAEEIPDVVKII